MKIVEGDEEHDEQWERWEKRGLGFLSESVGSEVRSWVLVYKVVLQERENQLLWNDIIKGVN